MNCKENIEKIKKNLNETPKSSTIVIGIAGGSGSGKSFLSKKLAEEFSSIIINMDDYYIRGICKNNKDVPRALDLELLKKHISELKLGKEVVKPIYTFGLKDDKTEKIMPAGVIIVDGLFALHKKFNGLLDCKIFIDIPEKIRLERRLKRDVEKRGYTKEHTLERWKKTVEPMYLKHVLPTKKFADVVIKN